MSFNSKNNKRTVRIIERLMAGEYGVPASELVAEPLDVLIRTILSQNTNDFNSEKAYAGLRKRFRNWDAVRLASSRQIEETIRIGGLAKTKARRIKRILSQICDRYGGMSLGFLCGMEMDKAAMILSEFEGVGPKTIACTLLFGCGMDVFPVDTHIHRISRRMGLIPQNASLKIAHKLWAQLLPRGTAYSLHLNLIEHGRHICHAHQPKCFECCLRRYCGYFCQYSR